LGSSERSNPRHYDPEGPRGLLRRGPDGTGPRRWWPITILTATVALAAGWWITISPVFAARHVEVTGTSRLTRGEVLRIAGVGPGTPLFWLRPGSVERRLEHDRWIASADVSRSLPGTLRISIRERRPVAQVHVPSGFLVLAGDGTVLQRSQGSRGVPTLISAPGSGRAHLGVLAKVAAAMNPWLRSRVARVTRTSGGSIVVVLGSNVVVSYGDASQVHRKGEALAAVMRWAIAGNHSLASINVQAPLAPTATLEGYVPPVTGPVAPAPSARREPTSAATSPSPSR
jgi:cell division protein FtsQ